jgi:ribosome maturation factor RimP
LFLPPDGDVVDQLETSVAEILAALGFDLVEFRQVGAAQRPLLQVRIDLPGSIGAAGVSSDDGVRASRALEQALEERGLVGALYTLEVSSPGDDRPLLKAADWRRFKGFRVKLKHQAVQGTVYGVIEDVDDISAQRTLVRVRPEDGTELMELDLAQMRESRLAPDLKPKPKPGKGGQAAPSAERETGARKGRSGGKKNKA